MPPTVDQHQSAVFTQAAQIQEVAANRAEPGIGTARQRATRRRGQRRITDQYVGDVGLAGIFDGFGSDRDNRVGDVQFGTGDARTGNDNRVFGGFFSSGSGSIGRLILGP